MKKQEAEARVKLQIELAEKDAMLQQTLNEQEKEQILKQQAEDQVVQ